MPCDYSKYPANWKTEIRPRILARAGEVRNEAGEIIKEAECEWCKAPNHRYRLFIPGSTRIIYRGPNEVPTSKDVQIILTIAHLDHDLTNNDDENLAALCQGCHLKHDAGQHAETARETREAKTGQISLFTE